MPCSSSVLPVPGTTLTRSHSAPRLGPGLPPGACSGESSPETGFPRCFTGKSEAHSFLSSGSHSESNRCSVWGERGAAVLGIAGSRAGTWGPRGAHSLTHSLTDSLPRQTPAGSLSRAGEVLGAGDPETSEEVRDPAQEAHFLEKSLQPESCLLTTGSAG